MTVIQTERLTLQKATFDDAEFIFQLLNDPTFIDNIVDKGIKTLDDAKNYIQQSLIDSYNTHGFGLYITRLKSDNTPIGLCGLLKREELEWPDVGYALLPEFVGFGYATEGAKASMEYGFKALGMSKIVAITSINNAASIKVLEKVGLRREKVIEIYGGESLLFS